MKTFFPFRWKDNWYALYSREYTCTRIMKLPECEDIGGEEPNGFGFCPVELYVPINPATDSSIGFGFVAGCVWGDDTSWKIQFLDLRECEKGVIKRDDRFGYLELPDDCSLEAAIGLDEWWWIDFNDYYEGDDLIEDNRWIGITHKEHFRLGTGKREKDDDDE